MRQAKHRHIHRNQHVSLNQVSLQELELRTKHSSTFVTQKTIAYEQEIQEYNRQLNHSLKALNHKAALAHQNQEELFLAFKHHMTRVRLQLEDFKRQNEAQASSSNSYLEKINLLERQLAIFRDESLRLFSRVSQKDKTIEQLKATLDQLLSEKKHMDALVKQLQRRNRQLESKADSRQKPENHMNLQINSFSKGFNPKNKLAEKLGIDPIRPASTSRTQNNPSQRGKTISFDYFSQFHENDPLRDSLKAKFPSLDDKTVADIKQLIFQMIGQDKGRRSAFVKSPASSAQRRRYIPAKTTINALSNQTVDLSQRPASAKDKTTLKQKSQQLTSNFQLCEYFKKCIDTVRKEMAVRQKVRTISFYKNGSPISIDQFKKIDFLRLMELICSHESVIEALYNALIEAPK